MILMLLFYITGLAFRLGGQINSTIEQADGHYKCHKFVDLALEGDCRTK